MLPSGSGLVVVAGVVDPVVVPGAQRDRVGEVGAAAGPRVVGGGARTRRRGVRNQWRRRCCVRGPRPLAGLRRTVGSPGRGRGRLTRSEDRREDAGGAGQAAGFAGGEGLVGVEVGCLEGAARTVWSMVTTTVAAVLVCRWSVGRCSRSSANASPRRWRQSKDPVACWFRCASVGVRSSTSMTLPSIAAASAGMVKCPVVVPSPLSCRVSEHFSRAVCSSVRMSSFSWASTIFWSGSTASIARRAMRRSWSGLNRAAFSTRLGSPRLWRCSSLTPGRQLTGGSDDHGRVFRGDEAGVQCLGGGVVPGLEVSRQSDLPGCVRTRHGGGLGEPGVGTGEPGVLRDASGVCGGDQLELHRFQATSDPIATRSPRRRSSHRLGGRTGEHPVQNRLDLSNAREHRTGALGWRSRSAAMGSIL